MISSNKGSLIIKFCVIIGIIVGNSVVGLAVSTDFLSNISFTENKGQIIDYEGNLRPDVLYTAEAPGTKIFVRKNGISYVTTKELLVENDVNTFFAERIDLNFNNANPLAKISAEHPLPGLKNFYLGHCTQGITSLKSYGRLRVENIYDNINVLYYGENKKGFKYDIVVESGGNVNDIEFSYSGMRDVKLIDNKLILSTSEGALTEFIPKVYQLIDGDVIEINASYTILNDNKFGFSVGDYDPDYSLIIDPWITYLGGASDETGYGIASDAAGNAYVCGLTKSVLFPLTVGTFQTSLAAPTVYADAYLSKFNSSGTLIWSTFYGGDNQDMAYDVAIDNINSSATIVGVTASSNLIVPGGLPFAGGFTDGFVANFITGTGQLNWSTYLGGSYVGGLEEGAYGVKVDGSNDIIVTGQTPSSDFPIMSALQNSFGGISDIFITKFNSLGSIVWSTFYGGTGREQGNSLTIDATDNIVVCGWNQLGNFPAVNAYQVASAGSYDAVLVKINSAGTICHWSSNYGSTGDDRGMGVDVDGAGNIAFSGYSTSATFPGINASAFQSAKSGTNDAFLVSLNPLTGIPIWGTFLGGVGQEWGSGVVVKGNDIYLKGWTSSNNFPTTTCSFQPNFAGGVAGSFGIPQASDIFLSHFDSNGKLVSSSYIGGSANDKSDWGNGICLVGPYLYVTGQTVSIDFPILNAYQPAFAGGGGGAGMTKDYGDAVVFKLCANNSGDTSALSIGIVPNKTKICAGESVDFTGTQNICDSANTQWNWTFSGSSTLTSTSPNPTGIIYPGVGIHIVTLEVITPCATQTITTSIEVNQLTAFISDSNNVTCFGLQDGGATIHVTGGSGPYNYNWSNNQLFNSPIDSCNINNLTNGIFSCTVTDNNGCSGTASVLITEPLLLQAFIPIQADIACNGDNTGSASGSAVGGTLPYSFTWSNLASTYSISNLTIGVYSLTVTDANGCSAQVSTILNEPPALGYSIINTSVTCNGLNNGQSIVTPIGGFGAYTYSWDTSPVQSSATASNLSAGTFTCLITDAYGCNIVAVANIDEPDLLDPVIFSTTDVSCNGRNDGSIQLTTTGGTGAYSYSWNTSPVQNNSLATGLSQGNYTCVISDANGCTVQISTNVTEPTVITPIVISQKNADCQSGTGGELNIDASGGDGFFSYEWNTVPVQYSSTATGLAIGGYTCTIMDGNGCTALFSANIVSPLSQVLDTAIIKNTICYGDNNGSVELIVSGGSPAYTFNWNNFQTTSIATQLSAGVYTCTITDAAGCIVSHTAVVAEPSQVIAGVSVNQSICIGQVVALTTSAIGGNGSYSFLWSPTGSTGTSLNISPTSTTAFTVEAVDDLGCKSLPITSAVTVNPLPIVAFTADATSGCVPLCVNFVSTTPGIQNWLWGFGDGNNSTNSSQNHCYTSAGMYNVSLTIIDDNGCTGTDNLIGYITIYPKPDAAFIATPTTTSILHPTVLFTNNSVGHTALNWHFGDEGNSNSSSENPSFTYTEVGSYKVTLVAINQYGCSDTTYDNIKIDPDHGIYIPNSFTPNGDSKNDFFAPSGVGISESGFEMSIFNRWGELIFKTNNLNMGWNGETSNGIIAQEDVYVWRLTFDDIFGKRHEMIGRVTVVR